MRFNQSMSTFKVILTAVLSLTIASGGTALYLGNRPTVTEQGDRVLDTALEIFKIGAISTFGLLSLCAGDDDELEDAEE